MATYTRYALTRALQRRTTASSAYPDALARILQQRTTTSTKPQTTPSTKSAAKPQTTTSTKSAAKPQQKGGLTQTLGKVVRGVLGVPEGEPIIVRDQWGMPNLHPEAAMNIAMAIMGGGAISGALRGAGSLARNLWGRVTTRVGSRAATRAATRATTRAATQAPPQPQVGRLNVLRNVYSTRTTTPSGVYTGGIRVRPGAGQPGLSVGQQNLAQGIARGSQAVQRATQAQPPGARLLQSIRTAGDNLS